MTEKLCATRTSTPLDDLMTDINMQRELSAALEEEEAWLRQSMELQELGWVRAALPKPSRNPVYQLHHDYEIVNWVRTNCVGLFRNRGSIWFFQNEKDAVIFSLRWL